MKVGYFSQEPEVHSLHVEKVCLHSDNWQSNFSTTLLQQFGKQLLLQFIVIRVMTPGPHGTEHPISKVEEYSSLISGGSAKTLTYTSLYTYPMELVALQP